MYENSTEMKIWRTAQPIIIYFLVNMLVQVLFTIIVTMTEFYSLGKGGIFNYFSSYNFAGDVERVVSENSLLVTIISGLCCIPVFLVMMKKDEDVIKYDTMKNHIKNIRFHSFYFIILLGALASLGLAKLVTLFPIDDIWGNYEEIQGSFNENALIWQILGLVFIGPCVEEIIFRGLVYKRIKRYTEGMAPVYVSALLFGLYHFNLVQGLYAFLLGILLCYVQEKYGTLLAPVLLHMSANLTSLIVEHISISNNISDNIFMKILLAVIETALMIALLWRMNTIEDINLKNHKLIDINAILKKIKIL